MQGRNVGAAFCARKLTLDDLMMVQTQMAYAPFGGLAAATIETGNGLGYTTIMMTTTMTSWTWGADGVS